MPLSAAEKQRHYRQKRDNNAQRRAEYLQKEKKIFRRFSKWKKETCRANDRQRETSSTKNMEKKKADTKTKKEN